MQPTKLDGSFFENKHLNSKCFGISSLSLEICSIKEKKRRTISDGSLTYNKAYCSKNLGNGNSPSGRRQDIKSKWDDEYGRICYGVSKEYL